MNDSNVSKVLGIVAAGLLAIVVGTTPVAGQGSETPVLAAEEIPQPIRTVRQSWTADRRAFEVGDVITVLIDEQTLATATTGDFASDRRRRDMTASGTQTVTGSYPRVAAAVGSSNDAESRRRGEAVRQNRFVGEMTVRVVAVENGLLHIQGSRSTNVDRARQELSLSGWVRPQDVATNNLVESWRIGDAELVYASSGDLGRPRGGILTRIISAIWP